MVREIVLALIPRGLLIRVALAPPAHLPRQAIVAIPERFPVPRVVPLLSLSRVLSMVITPGRTRWYFRCVTEPGGIITLRRQRQFAMVVGGLILGEQISILTALLGGYGRRIVTLLTAQELFLVAQPNLLQPGRPIRV